jgi:hypothetical protein
MRTCATAARSFTTLRRRAWRIGSGDPGHRYSLGTLLLLLSIACYGNDMQTQDSDRIVPFESRETSDVSIRQPMLRENKDAAALLETVRTEAGGNADRTALASLYESEGFEVMAAFFRASIDAIGGKAINWPASSISLWACGGDSEAQVALATALSRRLRQGYLHAVRTEAAAALTQNPTSCIMRLTHARATMLQTMLDPRSVTVGERELALRTWLTLTDEGNVLPAGSPDIVSVYIELAQYFSTVGDKFSALTAYRVARLRLSESVAAETDAAFIEERIKRLQATP